ncbi:NAD(+)/NADH kinase [Patescibacteria group bacterium]|nr:NAD(+)/NADH kinase [Patescibacteria group bacterium]
MRRISAVDLYSRKDNAKAAAWSKKIEAWLKKNYPKVKVGGKTAAGVIVLGGDGTIIEASRIFRHKNPLILGLNTGEVGFLASAREPKNFLRATRQFLDGKYSVVNRMMVNSAVIRNGREVFKTDSLNEVAVQSLLGIVKLEVDIEKYPLQFIRGSGVLVATATGSTAYNLSAHGPIVMPEIDCLIVTELLDHNIPTPSVVVKKDNKVTLKVIDFRERGTLSIHKTGQEVDVLLIADGETVFPLRKGDKIVLKRSAHAIKFAELEHNYFFKSLEEKFGFK